MKRKIIALLCVTIIVFTVFNLNASAQSGQKWSTGGNSLSSGDFLGSSNNQPLMFKVNNALALYIKPDGKVFVNSLSHNSNGIVSYDDSGMLIPLSYPNDATKVFLGNGTWGDVPIFQNYWQINNMDLYTTTPGNVGIGTNHPLFNLDVVGDVRISNNLYVGGGIIITDKVNATSEVNTGKINAAIELKSSVLRADSIIMDSTKAFYGYSKFEGDVQLKNKLEVIGNTVLNGETTVNGNFRTSGSLTFANNKTISFMPSQNGVNGNLCFGTQMPAQLDQCFSPSIGSNSNWFGGSINSWGNPQWNPQLPANVLSMGSDGANGIIEVSGTNPEGASGLLINYYCGHGVFVNTGIHGGDIQLAGSSGKVGIGVFPTNAKLEVAGNLKIGDLQEFTSSNYVLVEDGNGLVGKKSITNLGAEIGDDLGNHTATNNIILGDHWLTASTTENNGLHLTPEGNLTMIVNGNNSFEIKGGNEIPYRRGIGIPDEATSGQFNFYINPWQTDAAFNFIDHAPEVTDDLGTTYPEIKQTLMTILKNGYVGIGTTTPYTKLQIVDDENPALSISTPTGMLQLGISSCVGCFSNVATQNDVVLRADGGETEDIILATTNGHHGAIRFATRTDESYDIERMTILNNGNVNIGLPLTNNPNGYKLAVNGIIGAREVIIETDITPWPDYVFDNNYSLLPLNELEKFICANKHLPNIPSANEIKDKGIAVGEMNTNLLKKIEELTLYLIKQDKVINEQQLMINKLIEKTSILEQMVNH